MKKWIKEKRRKASTQRITATMVEANVDAVGQSQKQERLEHKTEQLRNQEEEGTKKASL